MASNQRKVYGETDTENAPACPHCGCRHRLFARATASKDRVIVTATCRHCGYATTENVYVKLPPGGGLQQ